jgi:dipeptidyl-peptidase-4
MFRRFLLPLLLAPAIHASGQQTLTLRDAVLKAGTDLSPERIRGLQWIKGTGNYSYVRDSLLMMGSTGKAPDRPLVDLGTLNKALGEDRQLRGIPAITWIDQNTFRFLHNGELLRFNLSANNLSTIASLPPDAANEDIEPTSLHIAYTIGNDLYVLRNGSQTQRITNDGEDGIVNGQSVHRQEYGINKGTFWAPKGERLAFYRMDERMVTNYQLEDISTRPSTFNAIRYPMAGQTSHQVTVGIVDMRDGSMRFLRTDGAADDYLTNIAWSLDGRHVHVVHLDRRTENLRLVRYDAATGEPVATLLTEQDPKYLEPEHPPLFLGTSPEQFLWRSKRDGWDHLYLYDVRKGLVRQLTKGPWNVKEVLGVDPTGRFAIIEGSATMSEGAPGGALETHIYRMDLATGRTLRLSSDAGTHSGALSDDASFLIDRWSSITVPGRVELRSTGSGELIRTLLDAKDPLANYTVGSIELLTVPISNGDRANARLIKPSHFREGRRYPVLIYVYNGPHVQLVSNSFLGGASHWMLEAAERGYLVWTLDGHGSAGRSKAFEQVVHRRLGQVEVEDQMAGVAFLKSLPYADQDRIAVHGWSFGGHMTTAMLTRHPGVFKVGVAGGPVMDWGLYEVMYTERYMDTPAENPEGYATTALPPLADKLQDDLLLITGGADDVVLPQHSLSFIQACVAKGVPVDFFDYPGHGHNVRGKDRLHLMEKVLSYIDQRIQHQR